MYIFGEYSILQRWSSRKEGTGLQNEVLSLVTPSWADVGGPGPQGEDRVSRCLPHAHLPSGAVGEADGPQINGGRRADNKQLLTLPVLPSSGPSQPDRVLCWAV